MKKSKMGPRRAAVLILINVLMISHLLYWLWSGRKETLSPVEPSESMHTLEHGLVNAGFIFFALSILSTLVLGRFFCGWGCHVVALQDLCAWFMKKVGVRPKPFRSRLLVWAPLLLALYMFVWPTFRREVLQPLAGQNWAEYAPYFGESAHRPKLKAALMKKDFWKTFPPWYEAIPFLAVCGFACVYFLGAKGFCTYGCPYGGFFAPADKIAPGRILVTDACEHCGHCTSVCTSNVRVHEEVRDFGMVVDPGCMKCMDCVSVCPNDALYFGFAKPSLVAKARTELGPKRFKDRVYDLSWSGEIAAAALFLALVLAFRSMLAMVPLLMAMGLAGIGVFLTWKLVQVIGEPNVRVQSLQLKLKGRIKPAGLVFGALAVVMLAAAAWSAVVKFSVWRGSILDDRIALSLDQVLAPGFKPSPQDAELATATEKQLRRSTPLRDGGVGWVQSPEVYQRLSRLAAIAGRFPDAESAARRAVTIAARGGEQAPSGLQRTLLSIMNRQAPSAEAVAAACRSVLAESPHLAEIRLRLAQAELGSGRPESAVTEAEKAAADGAESSFVQGMAGQIMLQAGQPERALARFRAAALIEAHASGPRIGEAIALGTLGRLEEAEKAARVATEVAPQDPQAWQVLAEVLRGLNRQPEAASCEQRARELLSRPPPPGG